MSDVITYDEAHTLLIYDANTGIFRWKTTRRGIPAGKIAGNVQVPEKRRKKPRVRIYVEGKSYLAHRLAWFMYYGEWPILEIDHKDGNSDNNAISNLRLATSSDNKHNRPRPHNNTSGATGVQYLERLGKWQATVVLEGKTYSLGCHLSFDGAVSARNAFCRLTHGEFFKEATCCND